MQPNIIKNFISKEICKFIDDHLEPASHEHKVDEAHPNGKKQILIFHNGEQVFLEQMKENDFENKLIILDIINLIQESVSRYFNLTKNEIKIKGMAYTNFKSGQGLPIHDDWGVSKCEVYSAVLYLNDSYEGGEILFYDNPYQNDEIKKSYKFDAGTLIYFPGNHDYVHEVMPVKFGSRSNFVIFFEGVVEKEKASEVKERNY